MSNVIFERCPFTAQIIIDRDAVLYVPTDQLLIDSMFPALFGGPGTARGRGGGDGCDDVFVELDLSLVSVEIGQDSLDDLDAILDICLASITTELLEEV